jgi:hypothetical protein
LIFSIKEESDDNFKKFKEKNIGKRIINQEDIQPENEECDRKAPLSMLSASRYESDTSVDSPVKVNMPNRTRDRSKDAHANMADSFVYQPRRNQNMSRNGFDRQDPVFRTFEGNISSI